jgi:cruciform cutting endonuclease 1
VRKLHRIATQIGTPCSGTKPVLIDGINRGVNHVDHGVARRPGELSLLSVDMGIKNLAYAHITAAKHVDANGCLQYDKPTLQAWERLDMSRDSVPSSEKVSKTESFEIVDYADRAYGFVKTILGSHRPNQILIERQRFRSNGGSAVQEWTIRVNIFEAMLHSVFRTLVEETKLDLDVQAVLPPQVNRYWLDDIRVRHGPASGITPHGREIKKAKITLVVDMLKDQTPAISIDQELQPLVDDFISPRRKGRSKGAAGNGSKLDDLADSLLQGLAFVAWRNNRERIKVLGEGAVDLETGDLR